jgi:uncharacterized delta-60 repeat protein
MLNPNGSVDSSFQIITGGLGVFDIKIQSDNKILVAGAFDGFSNGATYITRKNLFRLNADGTPDNSFGPPVNTVFFGPAYLTTVAQQTDGKVLVGDDFNKCNGIAINKIARLNTNGSLDTSFNVGAAALNNVVRKIFILSDNKIMVGGSFTQFSDNVRVVLPA